MDLILAFAICVISIIVIVSCNKRATKNAVKTLDLPPGPRGLPLLGNLLSLELPHYKTFSKWASEYGPIYTCRFLWKKVIVIADLKCLKELLQDDSMLGVFDQSAFDISGHGKARGIIFSQGRHWEEVRNFTLKKFRELGLGKPEMENCIMEEVNEFVNYILRKTDNCKRPLEDVKLSLFFPVINPLWKICFGKRLDQERDQDLLEGAEKAHCEATNMMKSRASTSFIYFPEISDAFAPIFLKFSPMRKVLEQFLGYFRSIISEHEQELERTGASEDLAHSFLKKIKDTTDPNSAFYKKVGDEQLLGVIGEFFTAGADSSSSSLSWLILYASKFPEIQRKLQTEIEQVVGRSRPVSLKDRQKMPFTQAVIEELLRFYSVSSFGVQHKSLKEREFRGYRIPKDALILGSVYHIHFSQKIWGDPENFRPERFLHNEGGSISFRKHEAMIAFSVGKRACIGKVYAMDILFLFAANLFQRLQFRFDINGPDFELAPSLAINLSPMPYRVFVEKIDCKQ